MCEKKTKIGSALAPISYLYNLLVLLIYGTLAPLLK